MRLWLTFFTLWAGALLAIHNGLGNPQITANVHSALSSLQNVGWWALIFSSFTLTLHHSAKKFES